MAKTRKKVDATPRPAPAKAFYTKVELAERWQVSDQTVMREVKRGRLAMKYVGCQVRFGASEVERYERLAGG